MEALKIHKKCKKISYLAIITTYNSSEQKQDSGTRLMTVGETHRTTERRWVKNWVRGGTEGAALKRERIIILFLVRTCLTMAILPWHVIFCQSRSLISLASPPTSCPLSFHYIFWLIQKNLIWTGISPN